MPGTRLRSYSFICFNYLFVAEISMDINIPFGLGFLALENLAFHISDMRWYWHCCVRSGHTIPGCLALMQISSLVQFVSVYKVGVP